MSYSKYGVIENCPGPAGVSRQQVMLSRSHARVLADSLNDNGVCVTVEPLFGDARRVIFPAEFHGHVVALLDELNTPVAVENVGKKSGTPEGLEGHVCGQSAMPPEKAAEGWWCRRPKGHEGPCAAEPPALSVPALRAAAARCGLEVVPTAVRPDFAVIRRLEAVRWENLQKDDVVWVMIRAGGLRTLRECKVVDPEQRCLAGRSMAGLEVLFDKPMTDVVYRDPQAVKPKTPAKETRRVVVLVFSAGGAVVDDFVACPVLVKAPPAAFKQGQHKVRAAAAVLARPQRWALKHSGSLTALGMDENDAGENLRRQLDWDRADTVEVD